MSRTWKGTFLLGAAVFLVATSWVIFDFFVWVPDFSKLKESVPVPIRLFNGDKSTRTIGPRAPGWTPLNAMAPSVPRAVVASEDASFYSHKGLDVYEMQQAFKKDLQEGRFARGASTITQQVLKNVFLSDYPRVWRKVKEIAWASKLEQALTKPQILAFYLNMAEWGPGIYGITEASRHYFGVPPSELSARQAAFLTMLLPSPRRYHAYFRKRALTEWAAKRVNRILAVMNKMGHLSNEEYQVALNENLWGAEVISDSAPGSPADPGWDAQENDSEQFEPSGADAALARSGQRGAPAAAPAPVPSLEAAPVGDPAPSAEDAPAPSEPADLEE